MQELEKILYELEKRIFTAEVYNDDFDGTTITNLICLGDVRDILEKHIDDGWIPVEERLPEDNKYILLSFSNFELQIVGRYDKDEEGNGAFYIGDCDEQDTCIANDLYVNAWRPLPAPYREE